MNGKIVRLDEVDSTSEYIKQFCALGENVTVVAKRQTGGRGTKGRSFSSNEGGLFFSRLVFYENLPARNAFLIMQSAAAAVCEALAFFGFSPVIKWPNDVFVNGKKICGILIENALSGNRVCRSVVGIGLNVNNALPDELTPLATSMRAEAGKPFALEEVEKKLFAFLDAENTAEKYRRYLGFMGENVVLVLGEKRLSARLTAVDDEGGLWAEVNGEQKRFTAAEVSVCTY